MIAPERNLERTLLEVIAALASKRVALLQDEAKCWCELSPTMRRYGEIRNTIKGSSYALAQYLLNGPTIGTGSMATGSADWEGSFTTGATVTSDALTFAGAWIGAPNCVVSTNNTGITAVVSAVSATSARSAFRPA